MTKEDLWTFFMFYEPLGIIFLTIIFVIIYDAWMDK